MVLIPSKEEAFIAPNGGKLLRLVNEVKQGLKENEISVLDLYEPMRHASSAPFFAHDIHMNRTGNKIAADQIAEWIQKNGLPPRP